MRSYAPAIVVCLLGVALMLVGVAGWVTSPPSLAHRAKPAALAPVTIPLASPKAVPVSITSTGIPIATSRGRGGQAN